ncbi:MAG: hypothetical protein OEW86_08190 [Nitrosopumilus sp.]|nr:hypothetical protein [Nitrosopumilus sp.]
MYSQIADHSLKLSSVWIGSFDEEKVEILNLEESNAYCYASDWYSKRNARNYQ